MDTYTYDVNCDNCATNNTLTIEKGETVKPAVAVAICENCGCNIKQ